MLQKHLYLSRAKRRAGQLYLWWRAWLVPVLTLCALTTIVIGALCVSGYTNEPVWPAPVALQALPIHLW